MNVLPSLVAELTKKSRGTFLLKKDDSKTAQFDPDWRWGRGKENNT